CKNKSKEKFRKITFDIIQKIKLTSKGFRDIMIKFYNFFQETISINSNFRILIDKNIPYFASSSEFNKTYQIKPFFHFLSLEEKMFYIKFHQMFDMIFMTMFIDHKIKDYEKIYQM